MELSEPSLIVEGGFLVGAPRIARLDDGGAFPGSRALSTLKQIPFPDRERDTVMSRLLDSASVPPLDVDEALKFDERRVQPRLGLRVTQQKENWGEEYFQALLLAGLWTRLDRIRLRRPWTLVARGARVYLVRDAESEGAARETLRNSACGRRRSANAWRMGLKAMPKVVRELIHAGWHVEAEGKAFRRPGTTRVDVRTGIDWFELHGEVDYDGQTASLPQLLAAVRRGDTMVRLGDGTYGLLPEEWLERFAPLAGLGTRKRITCASSAIRRACSMRCSRPSRRSRR